MLASGKVFSAPLASYLPFSDTYEYSAYSRGSAGEGQALWIQRLLFLCPHSHSFLVLPREGGNRAPRTVNMWQAIGYLGRLARGPGRLDWEGFMYILAEAMEA